MNQAPTRVAAYIDGFNLYFGLKSKGWRRYYWYDPHLLAQNLLKPWQVLVRVKYFTARISADPKDADKHKRQATWLEAVETRPLTSIFYGHYLRKPQRCFGCGATWYSHEEKMTDVNIAVHLLEDAYDDVFDTALLISADSDLAAPVEAVRRRFAAKRIVVVAPPDRKSQRLESLASVVIRLGRKTLHDSQLPDQYTKPDGFVLKRPAMWA
jgi:uncharacterized LabA/DUF88 family protein